MVKRGLYWELSSPDSVSALGTAVMDLLERRPLVDASVLPAGGGTVASAARIVRHYGEVWGRNYKVIVACPESAPTVYESFKAGRPVVCVTESVAGAVNVGIVRPRVTRCAAGCDRRRSRPPGPAGGHARHRRQYRPPDSRRLPDRPGRRRLTTRDRVLPCLSWAKSLADREVWCRGSARFDKVVGL
ncbi:pyridoxal-phosphate dependent enzyme [Nocardia stercoris]|uniref:Pyridoxal-phosphate dependent enzyme n=1 Tax=Nocardia stercoris TaxID=2483361 RepID=A0A3M2L3D7_9NOCA|nr:pyridoxal-phosphate dependent enzyme [Nocardia stercoris]